MDDGNPHPLTFEFSNKKHIFQFLKQLITKLSIPKRAGEELAYLPTQVLFVYFEKKHGDLVDGLIYPSIQTGLTGQNLVLFPLKSKNAKENYILNHDENINNPFIDLINYDALPPTLKFIKDSLIFHKITAIKTESEDSENITQTNLSAMENGRRPIGKELAKRIAEKFQVDYRIFL